MTQKDIDSDPSEKINEQSGHPHQTRGVCGCICKTEIQEAK